LRQRLHVTIVPASSLFALLLIAAIGRACALMAGELVAVLHDDGSHGPKPAVLPAAEPVDDELKFVARPEGGRE
jgi:hypothetical protein